MKHGKLGEMNRSTPTRFNTPLVTDVNTRSMVTSPPYSLSPRPVIIPTISPTSSKNLKRGQQRHTRLTLVAREREDSLICTAYHQAHCPVIEIAITHSLSLSALFNRSRPRVSAFPRVQSSGRPFPPERKLENLGFSTE